MQNAIERPMISKHEHATDDPAELAARRDDWETTKAHLNESHSSDRKLFP